LESPDSAMNWGFFFNPKSEKKFDQNNFRKKLEPHREHSLLQFSFYLKTNSKKKKHIET
jgi:hypothetical protein